MEDDAVTDVHTSRELASDGLGTAVSSSWIKAASQASICPPVCLSVCLYLTSAIGQKNFPNTEAQEGGTCWWVSRDARVEKKERREGDI